MQRGKFLINRIFYVRKKKKKTKDIGPLYIPFEENLATAQPWGIEGDPYIPLKEERQLWQLLPNRLPIPLKLLRLPLDHAPV